MVPPSRRDRIAWQIGNRRTADDPNDGSPLITIPDDPGAGPALRSGREQRVGDRTI
jgi:hypothetical protein